MTQASQKPLQTSIVYGLVSGVTLGIVEIVLFFLVMLTPSPLAMFFGRLTTVVMILVFLYAGYQAARRTGQLFAGTLAGALTGVFGVFTVLLFLYLLSFLSMSFLVNPDMLGIPLALPFVAPMASPLVQVTLTFAAYGAIGGTLGGLVGKQRARH